MDTRHRTKFLVLIASLLVVIQVLSVNADLGLQNDRDRDHWDDVRDKWAGCPRQFRIKQAPYCYRYWRYFVNLDPWYGRSITDNSWNDWYSGGWGYVPIKKMTEHKKRNH